MALTPEPRRVLWDLRRRVRAVWTQALGDTAKAVGTGAVAWLVSHHLLGHERPAFAAIAAIVSLAPGIVSHRKQALGMMTGVITGILVADGVLAVVPASDAVVRIALASFASMAFVALVGLMPIMVIQAGVSAALVASGLDLGGGGERVIDALVGGGLALVVSQVLLTSNPFARVDAETARFLAAVAQAFADAAAAVPRTSSSAIERAFDPLFERLQALHAALDRARSVRTFTLRGRLAGPRLDALVKRRRRGAMRVGVAALGLGEALRIAVRTDPEALLGKADRLTGLAELCATIEKRSDQSAANTPSPGWLLLADAIDALAREVRPAVAASDARELIHMLSRGKLGAPAPP